VSSESAAAVALVLGLWFVSVARRVKRSVQHVACCFASRMHGVNFTEIYSRL